MTPLERADLEIMALMSAPELQKDSMVGGPTPPEMQAENERKDAEYQRRRLAIIAKYGVAEEYLKPLYENEQRLSAALADIRNEIAALEALRI